MQGSGEIQRNICVVDGEVGVKEDITPQTKAHQGRLFASFVFFLNKNQGKSTNKTEKQISKDATDSREGLGVPFRRPGQGPCWSSFGFPFQR